MVIKSQQTDPAQLEAVELKGRLDAYREIHAHWEFADLTEAEFDDWLHEHIKSLRKQLALLLNESDAPAPSKEQWAHPTWEPALPPPTPPPVKGES